jgi:hypothetical protein
MAETDNPGGGTTARRDQKQCHRGIANGDSGTAGRRTRRRRCNPPWYEPLPLTDHQLAGAEAAAALLLAHQLPPIFPLPVIRAMWRRGDRRMALRLAKIQGVCDG